MTEEKKSTYRGYSQAQNKATAKYLQANYSRVYVWIKKDEKERYRSAAARAGLSLNEFVKTAMDEKIERDLLD